MRRIPALLCVAGLAAAPASAVAGPSNQPRSQMVEWSVSATSKGLGVMVTSLTPELRKHFGAPDDRGVLVARVTPGTPAARAGIEVGDVIVEVRGRKIGTASDVRSALEQVGKNEEVAITIWRDGASRSLGVTLPDRATTNAWSWPSLEDWMKSFDTQPGLTPLDGPMWLRDWLRPLELTKRERADWRRTLRRMFGAEGEQAMLAR